MSKLTCKPGDAFLVVRNDNDYMSPSVFVIECMTFVHFHISTTSQCSNSGGDIRENYSSPELPKRELDPRIKKLERKSEIKQKAKDAIKTCSHAIVNGTYRVGSELCSKGLKMVAKPRVPVISFFSGSFLDAFNVNKSDDSGNDLAKSNMENVGETFVVSVASSRIPVMQPNPPDVIASFLCEGMRGFNEEQRERSDKEVQVRRLVCLLPYGNVVELSLEAMEASYYGAKMIHKQIKK